METGTTASGLAHIVGRHKIEFANIGVSQKEILAVLILAVLIPAVLIQAIRDGIIVDYQGKGTERPIYETIVAGQRQRIAILVGSNGYIVGANPKGRVK